MKKMKLILPIFVLVASCGVANGEEKSDIRGDGDPLRHLVRTSPDIIAIAPVQGTLLKVVHSSSTTPEGETMVTTDVVMGFDVGCVNELAPVTHTYSVNLDKKVDLVVSAYEQFTRLSLVIRCQRVQKTYTASLNGFFAKEDLNIGFTEGKRYALPQDLTDLTVTTDMRISNVTQLCPPGREPCPVDGTRVSLTVTTFGCFDQATVSYATAENDNGQLMLYVNAVNIGRSQSQKVYCYVANNETIHVDLKGRFYEPENIILQTVPTPGI